MKTKISGLKRSLAFMLTLVMLASLFPMSALADSWGVLPPSASPYVYYYGGQHFPEAPRSVSITGPSYDAATNSYQISTKPVSVPVQQYALNSIIDDDMLIYTYCSDLAVKPTQRTLEQAQEDDTYVYSRIQVEQITETDWTYFGGTPASVKATAEKLRGILLKSDLWFEQSGLDYDNQVADLAEAAGITGTLTKEQIVYATQVAIWNVVNRAAPIDTSLSSTANEGKLYNYLISSAVAPVPADTMAQLKPLTTSKEQTGDTYRAVVDFIIEGTGSNGAVVDFTAGGNSVVESVQYRLLNGNYVDIDHTIDPEMPSTVIVENVPGAAELKIVASTTTPVTNVYLYSTRIRSKSQTLVSVESENQKLETEVKFDAPSNLAQLPFSKSWVSGEYPLGNNVVADYTATFKITHASPDDRNPDGTAKPGTLYGQNVIPEIVLNGNESKTTGFFFEASTSTKLRVYKIEETATNAAAGIEVTPLTDPQYFKVVYSTGLGTHVIEWCDADGNPAPESNGVFTNSIEIETGNISVTKSAPNGVKIGGEVFEFVAKYTPAGSSTATEFESQYTVTDTASGSHLRYGNTLADGKFTLEAGQTATFYEIPVGAKLTVTETENAAYETTVTAIGGTTDVFTGTQTVVKGVTSTIAFENTYRTGKITINKTFTGVVTDWSKFPTSQTGINFIIQATAPEGNNYYKVVTLPKGQLSVTELNVPVGSYTVTEVTAVGATNTANLSSYVLDATGSQSVTVDQGATGTANFTNNYQRGSIEITKKVTLIGINESQISGAVFEFTLTGPAGPNSEVRDITLTKDEPFKIENLAPGTYTLVEDMTIGKAGVSGIRHDATGNGTMTIEIAPNDVATKEVEFTNTYSTESAKLRVSKMISLNGVVSMNNAKFDDFSFTVIATHSVTGATIPFVLNKGNDWTWQEVVPLGTYKFTETDHSTIDYHAWTHSFSAASLTLNDRDEKSTTVTNTYTRQTGSVSFEKTVINGAYGDKFDFTVNIKDGGANLANKTYKVAIGSALDVNKTTNSSGNFDITGVPENTTVVIKGLPAGAEVTVTEKPVPTYYTVGYSGAGVSGNSLKRNVVADTTTPMGMVTNTRKDNFNLTLEKGFGPVGEKSSALNWSSTQFATGILFTITGQIGRAHV